MRKQIAIALGQLLNALLGGSASETFAARCYLKRKLKYWKQIHQLLDLLFFWQKRHCHKAYRVDAHRKQQNTQHWGKLWKS